MFNNIHDGDLSRQLAEDVQMVINAIDENRVRISFVFQDSRIVSEEFRTKVLVCEPVLPIFRAVDDVDEYS